MFSLIGLVVLVIACINFVNLSTARSGAITIPWSNAWFWVIMIGYVLVTSVLAGSRPALYLSSLRPVKVLKGGLREGRMAALPRKILVVLQFTCSVALIISTVIVYRQVQYAKNRPRGFDADRLVMTDGSSDLDHNYTALKSDLLQTRLVSGVTRATAPATALFSWTGVDEWQGKIPGENLGVATVGIHRHGHRRQPGPGHPGREKRDQRHHEHMAEIGPYQQRRGPRGVLQQEVMVDPDNSDKNIAGDIADPDRP